MHVATAPATPPVLEARGINKHFGPVQALKDVDFKVYPGEVVALIGDNGAGQGLRRQRDPWDIDDRLAGAGVSGGDRERIS